MATDGIRREREAPFSDSLFAKYKELGERVEVVTSNYPCASAVFFLVYAFFGFYNLLFGTLTNFALYTVTLGILASGMTNYQSYADALIEGVKSVKDRAIALFQKK